MSGDLHDKPRRRLLRAAGCACVGALGFSGLVAAQSIRPPGMADSRRNAWSGVQKPINDARSMADRITSSLDSLTSIAATASLAKDKLEAALARLSAELAQLEADKNRLLEEYRNGLFCSGCNKTKSQILAQGDTFPHPGQTVIRPTPAQIDAKERELQAPIDRTQRNIERDKKDLAETMLKQSMAFDQIRAGAALWRTTVTYWRGSIHRGVRDQRAFQQAELEEFERALQAEQREAARRGEPVGNADVWRRLLDKHKAEVQAFDAQAHKASMDTFERTRTQQAAISGYLRKDPLPKTLLAVVVVNAPVGAGLAPHQLGVDFHLGDLAAVTQASPMRPPPLPRVAEFVGDFKAAALPDVPDEAMADGGPPTSSTASAPTAVLPPAAPARPGNARLLQALP